MQLDNCYAMRNVWPVYRPSANPPQTAWARHLDQVMRDRDWSRVRLFEEVGTELGYRPKSRTAMLPLLTTKEPDEAKAAVLRKHFGDPPVEPEPISVEDDPTLARALSDLAGELRESRRQRETIEGRLVALEAELESLRARRATGAREERSALVETTG